MESSSKLLYSTLLDSLRTNYTFPLNINPHEEISKLFRGDFRFSSEEQKNSSDLSFHSSEVSFDSSEVSFDSSEEISLASVENFLFPASYWKFPPWERGHFAEGPFSNPLLSDELMSLETQSRRVPFLLFSA